MLQTTIALAIARRDYYANRPLETPGARDSWQYNLGAVHMARELLRKLYPYGEAKIIWDDATAEAEEIRNRMEMDGLELWRNEPSQASPA
jgi:hypothetical protein